MILTLKPPQCITRFHKRPRLLATASLAPERAAIRKADKLELACPVCLETFCNEEQDLSPISGKSHFFTCGYCKKGYSSSSKGIIDLTIPSSTLAPIGTSFFQNPVLAFTYDRGYRDLFWIWNFPGYDEEFRMADEIMKPHACGEIIMDLSCGTGSFTRRFLSSKSYKAVVAADYSESMLEQCHGFLKTDKTVDISKVILLRADAARLPFASNSLAAVHSGAAIHCWPQPSVAVAEVARVLRPGGVFVASTFMFPEPPSPLDVLINPIRQMTMELQLPFKAWTANEIRSIVKNSGLVNWTSISREHTGMAFAIFKRVFHFHKRVCSTFSCSLQYSSFVDFKEFACPICLQPFSMSNKGFSLRCNTCFKSYNVNSQGVVDLTIPASSATSFASSIFRNQYVAQFYDKAYRDQSFQLWGFPGFQEEFKMAQEILKPCIGDTILDLSCAGGSLTHKFLVSDVYKLVIASDYSEAMLNQCSALLKNDARVDLSKVLLVKADAGRLPFTSSSLAAVHSSAAIHCWPQPLHAVAEIARVLKPGGVFVASTFLFPKPPSFIGKLVQPLREIVERVQFPLPLWTESELRQIVEGNGFVNWASTQRGAFILFSVTKPM